MVKQTKSAKHTHTHTDINTHRHIHTHTYSHTHTYAHKQPELLDWLRQAGGLPECPGVMGNRANFTIKKNMYFIVLCLQKNYHVQVLSAVFANICIKYCFHYDNKSCFLKFIPSISKQQYNKILVYDSYWLPSFLASILYSKTSSHFQCCHTRKLKKCCFFLPKAHPPPKSILVSWSGQPAHCTSLCSQGINEGLSPT